MKEKKIASNNWIGFIHWLFGGLFLPVIIVLAAGFFLFGFILPSIIGAKTEADMDAFYLTNVFTLISIALGLVANIIGVYISAKYINATYKVTDAKPVALFGAVIILVVGILTTTFANDGQPILGLENLMQLITAGIFYGVSLLCLKEDREIVQISNPTV